MLEGLMRHRIDKNRYDTTGENLSRGISDEERFIQAALDRGYQVSKSDVSSDMNDHWDYLIESDDEKLRVEVKAMKKVRRSDPAPQDEWVWIEIKGVRPYDPGWLYGKADIIAFETKRSFLLVDRKELLQFVENNTDKSCRVYRPEDAMQKTILGIYKVYCRRRQEQPDMMVLIETEQLRKLHKTKEWFIDETEER
jgi:hypothetical protein